MPLMECLFGGKDPVLIPLDGKKPIRPVGLLCDNAMSAVGARRKVQSKQGVNSNAYV